MQCQQSIRKNNDPIGVRSRPLRPSTGKISYLNRVVSYVIIRSICEFILSWEQNQSISFNRLRQVYNIEI